MAETLLNVNSSEVQHPCSVGGNTLISAILINNYISCQHSYPMPILVFIIIIECNGIIKYNIYFNDI